jgi:hypothetical protein
LQSIKGFETISKWASFHHEKLNGKGYPFHLEGSNLPLGSKINVRSRCFSLPLPRIDPIEKECLWRKRLRC